MKFRYLIYALLAVAQPVKFWAAGLTQQNKTGCSRRSAGGPSRYPLRQRIQPYRQQPITSTGYILVR